MTRSLKDISPESRHTADDRQRKAIKCARVCVCVCARVCNENKKSK